MARTFNPKPLTGEAFRAFGDVIEEDGANATIINRGDTLRINDLCTVRTEAQGWPLVSFFKPLATAALPFRIQILECHPLGSQAFIPREKAPFLIAVAPPAPKPDLDSLQVFVTDGVQGVNYAPGVWHLPLASFTLAAFVVIDRGGPGENLRECDVTESEIVIGI